MPIQGRMVIHCENTLCRLPPPPRRHHQSASIVHPIITHSLNRYTNGSYSPTSNNTNNYHSPQSLHSPICNNETTNISNTTTTTTTKINNVNENSYDHHGLTLNTNLSNTTTTINKCESPTSCYDNLTKANNSSCVLNYCSKVNYGLSLLSDASDHYQEEDVECIALRKEAIELLKDFKLDKTHVAQLYQIGLHYIYENDYAKAFEIFKEANDYHYPAAAFQLARFYESGILETIQKDNKMAQKYYRQSALNGYCKAMFRIGMAYLHGEIGCRKSKKEAITWLHRCTWSINEKEQNVVGEAMYQLSKFYEKGMTHDICQDHKSAASYLRMAAEKNCVDAQDYLGYCYQHGHLNYPVNFKKALYWFTQAANGHCIESKISLCHLYLTGAPPEIPQDDAKALFWIKKAATSTFANNNTQNFSKAKAQYILGWFYEEGLENVLEKNTKEAIQWYLKAAHEGVPDAKMSLKHFKTEEINEVADLMKSSDNYQKTNDSCTNSSGNNKANANAKKLNEKIISVASSLLFGHNKKSCSSLTSSSSSSSPTSPTSPTSPSSALDTKSKTCDGIDVPCNKEKKENNETTLNTTANGNHLSDPCSQAKICCETTKVAQSIEDNGIVLKNGNINNNPSIYNDIDKKITSLIIENDTEEVYSDIIDANNENSENVSIDTNRTLENENNSIHTYKDSLIEEKASVFTNTDTLNDDNSTINNRCSSSSSSQEKRTSIVGSCKDEVTSSINLEINNLSLLLANSKKAAAKEEAQAYGRSSSRPFTKAVENEDGMDEDQAENGLRNRRTNGKANQDEEEEDDSSSINTIKDKKREVVITDHTTTFIPCKISRGSGPCDHDIIMEDVCSSQEEEKMEFTCPDSNELVKEGSGLKSDNNNSGSQLQPLSTLDSMNSTAKSCSILKEEKVCKVEKTQPVNSNSVISSSPLTQNESINNNGNIIPNQQQQPSLPTNKINNTLKNTPINEKTNAKDSCHTQTQISDNTNNNIINSYPNENPQKSNNCCTLNEDEKNYISKLNHELLKSLMITNSAPTSPCLSSFSATSSNSSTLSDDVAGSSLTCDTMSSETSTIKCSTCSLSGGSSSCDSGSCDSCPSLNCYLNPKLTKNCNTYISSSLIQCTNINDNCCSQSNNTEFDTCSGSIHSKTNSLCSSSTSSMFGKLQTIKDLSKQASIDDFDKSKITSTDRMNAYTHYKIVTSSEKLNKSKDSLKLKGLTTTATTTPSHKSYEKDGLSVGLTSSSSSTKIFDPFEKNEDHHNYGLNHERVQSSPAAILGSNGHLLKHKHKHNSSHHSYLSILHKRHHNKSDSVLLSEAKSGHGKHHHHHRKHSSKEDNGHHEALEIKSDPQIYKNEINSDLPPLAYGEKCHKKEGMVEDSHHQHHHHHHHHFWNRLNIFHRHYTNPHREHSTTKSRETKDDNFINKRNSCSDIDIKKNKRKFYRYHHHSHKYHSTNNHSIHCINEQLPSP